MSECVFFSSLLLFQLLFGLFGFAYFLLLLVQLLFGFVFLLLLFSVDFCFLDLQLFAFFNFAKPSEIS